MDQSSFANKFISRLEKIDPPQIESFLTQLVKEKDFHRAVFDCLQEAIIVADEEQRVVFANEASRLFLTPEPRRAGGAPLRRAFRLKGLKGLAEEFGEEPRVFSGIEIRARRPEPRIYSVTVHPLWTEGASAAHSVWIVADRTADHERMQEKRQFESIQSLATLTAGIAHEVKNPLNSMNIHVQLIHRMMKDLAMNGEAGPEAERLERSSEVLLEEIARLTRIVDQFIKAARPAKLSLQMADLNEVVGDVARLIEPDCERRHIDLEVDTDPVLPRLEIDAEQMKQAILNLAKNAMEAIDKPEGKIALRTSLQGEAALVEVEDNGCGIPEEDRLRIFEPYHSTKFDGSGLGLMVVFRIVRAHRGGMALDSELGRGSVFRVALPLSEMPVRLLETSPSSITLSRDVAPEDMETGAFQPSQEANE